MVNLVTYITITSTRKHNNIEELFLLRLYYKHIVCCAYDRKACPIKSESDSIILCEFGN